MTEAWSQNLQPYRLPLIYQYISTRLTLRDQGIGLDCDLEANTATLSITINFRRIFVITESHQGQTSVIKDQRLWSLKECVSVLKESLDSLKQQYRDRGELVWDKVNYLSIIILMGTV